MTIEGIIKDFNIDTYIFIPKSHLDYFIKKAKYIDVYEYWYDIFNPENNIWIDIEGMGYGCMWSNTKLRKYSKILQKRAIKKFALTLISDLKPENEILYYQQDGDNCYGFINKDGTCYTRIRISDKELDRKVW